MISLFQHVYNNLTYRPKNILVLGFYHRQNAGDEMYKVVIPKIFESTKANFIFKCFDDIKEIPKNIDFVICGGGDIINSYFMAKAETLFGSYTGRVYAFSIGIPYESEARYLHLFDHVFVRSKRDYAIACKEIGSRNTTYLPDASMALISTSHTINSPRIIKLGICLAQPAFHNNPQSEELIESIVNALIKLHNKYNYIQVHLLSFNYGESPSESDFFINDKVQEKLLALDKNYPVFYPRNLKDPMQIFNRIKTLDVVLCMRYHSVLFSCISNKTIVAMYCTSKVNSVVSDFDANIFDKYKLPTDAKFRPCVIDTNILYDKLANAFANNNKTSVPLINFLVAKKIMFDNGKKVNVLIKTNIDTFDNTLFNCKKWLMKYLNIPSSSYESMLKKVNKMYVKNQDYTNVARIICYCITKSIQSPYLWGLAENMKKKDFCLYDAIKYIWEDCKSNEIDADTCLGEKYYPVIQSDRRVFVNLDYVFSNDFKNYHRSGWAYVVGGMMNLDAHQLLRTSNVMIDTYIDRSFHWGLETLETVGILPYTKPWIGFIHHTFDILHSSFNCVELFANPLFLQSLSCCKGLIALTDYLAKDLKIALISKGFGNVPVHVIYHPMETVDKMFTFEKFLENKQRKVVQIGAWLRDAYAIYNLDLWKNKLQLSKCALKGKDMDLYFKPEDFLKDIKKVLYKESSDGEGEICRSNSMCRPTCISGNQVQYYCNQVNKYCSGLYSVIEQNDKSVTVIDRITNEDYDDMLSNNIVFLKLVDCSAVNTVLECLVRNTVIVINRHPAVEEILGESYPCFYDDLIDATLLLNDIDKIRAAYLHLKKLSKRRYRLDYFMDQLQNIVANIK